MLRAIGLISRSWQSWDPHSITVIIAEPKGDPPIPESVSVIATVEVDLEDEIIPRAVGAAGAPIMKSSAFIAASAAVILLLGLVHLLYTFRGPKLHPRDPDLTARMMAVSPLITRETTMWRVWVGINATHSFGLILFGALYGYLAIRHSASLFHSWFLLALGFALLLGYAVIAKLYFFTAPFRGVMLAVALYLFGIVVNLAQSKFR